MENKEFLQGYRGFIVFAVSVLVLAYFMFRMDFSKPETLIHSQFIFWWFSSMCGMILGKNIVRYGIDAKVKKDVKPN